MTVACFIQYLVLLQQYWAKEAEPYRFLPAAEMAEAFRNSAEGRAAAEELAQPPERTKQGMQSLADQERCWATIGQGAE